MLIVSRIAPAGFTLIELLITVVIVSILAMIGLPSYQASIAVGRRTDVQAELLRLAHAQTRWRSDHIAYADLAALGGATQNDDYDFSETHTATTFSITATPTSVHAQDQDPCHALSINQEAHITSSVPDSCPKP